jgi:hypothetical protein
LYDHFRGVVVVVVVVRVEGWLATGEETYICKENKTGWVTQMECLLPSDKIIYRELPKVCKTLDENIERSLSWP